MVIAQKFVCICVYVCESNNIFLVLVLDCSEILEIANGLAKAEVCREFNSDKL